MTIQQFDAKIIYNKKITPDYYLLNLEAPSGFKNAQPGQFVHIKINNPGFFDRKIRLERSERPLGQIRREFDRLSGVSQILPVEDVRKIVQSKNPGYLAKPTKSSSDFVVQPLRGKFCYCKIWDNRGDILLRRPLSIYKIRNQKPEYRNQKTEDSVQVEILYEVVGRGTQVLSQKRAGEYLNVIGPLGRGFDYKLPVTSSQLPVLVAGGMGVAPLIFLAEKLVKSEIRPEHGIPLMRENPKSEIIVLIGARTKNKILCEKEFKDLGCEVKIATEDGSKGFKGRVTDLLKDLLVTRQRPASPAKRGERGSPRAAGHWSLGTLYACGPKPMLKELARIAQINNIPAQVSLEEFMGCGIGACLGCVIQTTHGYKRVCSDGPVFNAQDIVWESE